LQVLFGLVHILLKCFNLIKDSSQFTTSRHLMIDVVTSPIDEKMPMVGGAINNGLKKNIYIDTNSK